MYGCVRLHILLLFTCACVLQNAVATCQGPPGSGKVQNLTMMTFNTFRTGRFFPDGTKNVAANIRAVNPDIVALQEIEDRLFGQLMADLGPEWSGLYNPNDGHEAHVGIVTRHFLNKSTAVEMQGTIGAQVVIANERGTLVVDVWSVYLTAEPYGPDIACGQQTAKDESMSAAEERSGRVARIRQLMGFAPFERSLKDESYPTFVMGDFNAPSHLDWIDIAREFHCDQAFSWPVSSLMESRGFSDTFRELNPDPTKNLGITWPTPQAFSGDGRAISGPLDRIDFIYHLGGCLKPLEAYIYGNDKDVIKSPTASWSSDHFAVVATFEVPTIGIE